MKMVIKQTENAAVASWPEDIRLEFSRSTRGLKRSESDREREKAFQTRPIASSNGCDQSEITVTKHTKFKGNQSSAWVNGASIQSTRDADLNQPDKLVPITLLRLVRRSES